MFKPIVILIFSAGLLTGCSTVRDSRVNPFNWFGGSRSVAVQSESAAANPLIPASRGNGLLRINKSAGPYLGQPINQISELLIERRPGGAILRASGVADRQGPFDVRLLLQPVQTPGTLAYTLSAVQTAGARDASPWSRTVTAALWLTDQELAGIRTIRVTGRTNELVTTR